MNFRRCEICGLRSGRKDGTKRHFLARFPLDEARCKLWVKMTGNEDLAYIPIEKLHELKYVCGKHFKEKDFQKKKTQLKKTAVPSIRLSAKPLPDDVLIGFPCKMFKEQNLSKEEFFADLEAKEVLPGYEKIYIESEIPPIARVVEVETSQKQTPRTNVPSTTTTIPEIENVTGLSQKLSISLKDVPCTSTTIPEIENVTGLSQKISIPLKDVPCTSTTIPEIENVTGLSQKISIPLKDVPNTSSISTVENSTILNENVSVSLKGIKKRQIRRSKTAGNLNNQLTPRKKKLIRRLEKCKLTLKAFKKKAKVFDSIQSKALKTMLLSAWKNQNRCSQGKRWSNNDKALAIAMFKKSPKLYRYMRQLIPLPSVRTLQNILSKLPINPGINKMITNHLRKKASQLSCKDKTCVLLFDEMSLKKRLIYNHNNDKVEGYQDLGEHGRTADLADKALVLLIQGVHKKYKQPLAHYFVKGTISSEKLMAIIKNAIKTVFELGLNIIATVCDQGPTNVGALSLLKKFSGLPPDVNYFLVDGKKVNIIYDVPHLLKSIRNNFFEAGEMVYDGMKAQWRHIEEFHEKNKETLHFKKVTALHVYPKFRAKMKVKLAAQILSNDVAAFLKLLAETYRNEEETFKNEKERTGLIKREAILQTAKVIGQLDRLFDATNGPASKKDIKRGIRENVSKNSIHHKLWPQLKNKIKSMHFLKKDSQLKLKNVRCVNGYYTTISSLQDIWKYVESIGFKYLNLRQLNQDSLENLFGLIRQHSPTNRNPTCHHFTAALKSTILTKMSTPIRGANCEFDQNELVLDFQDLVFNSDADADETEHSYTQPQEYYYVDPAAFCDDFDDSIIHLPENETDVEKKLFETFKKQPVVYVSGYLASVLVKSTNCHLCWESLKIETPCEDKMYNYIALKEWWQDKLSLTYPTVALCRTVDTCVTVFEQDVRPHLHKNDIGKYCRLMMLKEVTISWLCEEHHKDIMDMLLFRLSTLLIRNECKKQNVLISEIEQINSDSNKKSQLMSTAK